MAVLHLVQPALRPPRCTLCTAACRRAPASWLLHCASVNSGPPHVTSCSDDGLFVWCGWRAGGVRRQHEGVSNGACVWQCRHKKARATPVVIVNQRRRRRLWRQQRVWCRLAARRHPHLGTSSTRSTRNSCAQAGCGVAHEGRVSAVARLGRCRTLLARLGTRAPPGSDTSRLHDHCGRASPRAAAPFPAAWRRG